MEKFACKLVTALEKVFPVGEEPGKNVRNTFTALKGETISFQIAYYFESVRKVFGQVQVESPAAGHVRVREVHLVPCEYPCHVQRDADYLTTVPGVYPDLLCDIKPWGFPLVSGQWRTLWVDFEAAADMEAGVYPVKILLKEGETLLGEAEVFCEVLDAVLPELPIPHTEWFHSDCLANYYGIEVFSEKYWEIVENFVKAAVKRKCNMLLTPVFTPPLDTAVGGERRTVQLVDVTAEDGGYSFGFDKFRRWVKMAQDCGIEYFEISHLFTQWGAKAAPKIMGMKDGVYVRLFGWETKAAGKEYADFLHAFLTALKQVLEELGIAEKTYFHVSDEPHADMMESYSAAKAVVAGDLKGYQMFDALSDYAFYEKGLVRTPVCAMDQIQPFLDKRPENLWCYYCTGQYADVTNCFIAMPGYRTRILGTQMYKFRLDGFLHWGYNFYNSVYSLYSINPYQTTDAGGAFPSGDPFLVYPGENGVPEESIRMMYLDEAMSDYCAMTLLEKLAGREKVLSCIEPEGAQKVEIKTYPRSISGMLGIRERIDQAIREAIKKEGA